MRVHSPQRTLENHGCEFFFDEEEGEYDMEDGGGGSPLDRHVTHQSLSLRDSRRTTSELKTPYFGAFQGMWLPGRS